VLQLWGEGSLFQWVPQSTYTSPFYTDHEYNSNPNKKTVKICFHCGQSGQFALQCPDRRQRQTSTQGKALAPMLHLTTAKTTPNQKGSATSAKVTTSCFNGRQVGHFANQYPNGHQQLAPHSKTCHNCGKRGHYVFKCCNPHQPLTPAPIANSAPNYQVNSTTSTIHQQFLQRP
jgi:hypothetical protein